MVEQSDSLSRVFAALADPTRRDILSRLLQNDLTVSDLSAPYAMSLAAVSKHLRILSDAGLVNHTKRGREKWCRIEPDMLREAALWMEGYGSFAQDNFDRLEELLERENLLSPGSDA